MKNLGKKLLQNKEKRSKTFKIFQFMVSFQWLDSDPGEPI